MKQPKTDGSAVTQTCISGQNQPNYMLLLNQYLTDYVLLQEVVRKMFQNLTDLDQLRPPSYPLCTPQKCFIQHWDSVLFCYVIEMGCRFE